jgi:hypothetical protein
VPTPHEKDTVWLPEATRQGWLIITRDRHIERRPAEIAAVLDFGARLVALFIYRATRTTLETVPLERATHGTEP